ncbi:MAG: PucC family protein [Myxococcota bacterium]
MRKIGARIVRSWVELGPRYMPFADIATPELPLTRLLRLTLFQVTVGMTLVLLVGTLNRVMIVELDVSATLVAAMVAVPVLFAPFRALIGFNSDNHRSALGWRRVPFIWRGTLMQFGGFAVMPFALLVLAGAGEAEHAPAWIGQAAAALAFLLVGGGAHTVQTAGLALATDLTPEESHPRVVGLMYVMLLVGMMGSALAFGAALEDFTPGKLVRVIQSVALIVTVLNVVAMWKQEARNPLRGAPSEAPPPRFSEAWKRLSGGQDVVRHLAVVGLGTMAFGMADVLLEPFGGQVLGLSVASTTQLTALLALGGLIGFGLASWAAARGADPDRVARLGALVGVPAFAFVIAAAPLDRAVLFLAGNFLIGFGGALFSHGTLTSTMSRAPSDQTGLALGAWGAVQATAAGGATAIGGLLRDGVMAARLSLPFESDMTSEIATGYLAVYVLEILLLAATVVAGWPLARDLVRRNSTRALVQTGLAATDPLGRGPGAGAGRG